MARFQQNIRKMSEKKTGANKLLQAVANGFYTVTDSDCVALSWFDDLVLDMLLIWGAFLTEIPLITLIGKRARSGCFDIQNMLSTHILVLTPPPLLSDPYKQGGV